MRSNQSELSQGALRFPRWRDVKVPYLWQRETERGKCHHLCNKLQRACAEVAARRRGTAAFFLLPETMKPGAQGMALGRQPTAAGSVNRKRRLGPGGGGGETPGEESLGRGTAGRETPGRGIPGNQTPGRSSSRRVRQDGADQRQVPAAQGDIPPGPTSPAEPGMAPSDSDGFSSDDELPLSFHQQSEGLSLYEKKRLKNIQENARFFASLNMQETAEKLREISKRHRIKRPNAFKRKKVQSSREQPIVRRSMRLLRLDPTGTPLPEIPIEIQTQSEERISGPVKMVRDDEDDSKETEHLMKVWLEMSQGEVHTKEKQPVELKTYKSTLLRMTMQEGSVAKVTPNRVGSLAFHPSPRNFLVAAGSTYGYIGLWDLSSQEGTVHQFKPHCNTINCLHFSPSNSAELLSLSNEGSIRCGNVAAAVFDEVYTSNTWATSSFDFLAEDGSTLIVSHWDGNVVVVDRRTPGTSGELDADLGINHFRTVGVHPMHRQYFVTAGTRCVDIYDVRNLKTSPRKAVASLGGHTKNVSSAYFSSLTGNKVVTTCMDDRIRIFDTSAIIPKIPVVASIIHNNYTGRWLTKFRAVWDPKRDDCFVVGSMARPRQIEVFHFTGSKVREFRDMEWLGSVCSINVMHPTRNVLVGGNSSGRLHVFTDGALSG
ncbi:WD repeat-containing protein 76 [Hemiscyllium ocellatum]|uniref:WD repeat-containing protein 76 n=1 Tax=Hemiscyllium ocellatum TaxID=170820 RepID=UPI0029669925|nr:WD repeat-containing protein 76 [Hemiscyllium ocellatum]